jgi:hypothetical protein
MENTNLYSNGKIYKLECSDGYYYIGSTRNTLLLRFLDHKKAARMHPERQLYSHILQLGWDHVCIKLIEDYACASKEELNLREDHYIQQAKNINDKFCLNINRAQITKEELKNHQKLYRAQNRDRIDEYMQHYRLVNAQSRREYSKAYAQANAESVAEYKKRHYEQNKEAISAKNLEYVKANRAAVNARKNAWQKEKRAEGKEERIRRRLEKREQTIARQKETISCECGGQYQMFHKYRHFYSKKHIKWENNKVI